MPKKHKTFQQLQRERGGPDPTRGRAYDKYRRAHPTLGRAARIRSSGRWQAVRDKKIRRNPLCELCAAGGVTRAADQVDHIEPIQTRPDLAFTMSNLQSLCTQCHAAKSARERRG